MLMDPAGFVAAALVAFHGYFLVSQTDVMSGGVTGVCG